MAQVDLDTLLTPILERDPRYARAAYHFVCEALDHTQGTRGAKPGAKSHVTAQELLEGIRQYALQQFGPLAYTVLEDWGIRSCPDFGEIVFNLIDHEIFSKTETDTREDFRAGFDFDGAFRRPFTPGQALSQEES
ncbi:MAG: hypothetical protein RLZ45_2130 [Verrucomicrobiota bacterium]|jgi:uncharacterized repeat protein (TIGR04138 family)